MANITASIQNTSRSVKGLNTTWVFNHGDWTITKTANKFTLARIGSALAYKALGCKDYNNAGSELVVPENLCTSFKHKYSLSTTEATGAVTDKAAAKAMIDKADKIFVVVKTNDGLLLGYGLDYALWKTTQGQMANENNATTAIEFATRDQMEEEYSCYYYTGTEADLDALMAL